MFPHTWNLRKIGFGTEIFFPNRLKVMDIFKSEQTCYNELVYNNMNSRFTTS